MTNMVCFKKTWYRIIQETIKISKDKKIKCRFLSYLESQLDKLQQAKASGCVHSKIRKNKKLDKIVFKIGVNLIKFLCITGSIH